MTTATRPSCPCPGPLCGEQSYAEMFDEMLARYRGPQMSEHDLRQIHLKWKKLGAEVR